MLLVLEEVFKRRRPEAGTYPCWPPWDRVFARNWFFSGGIDRYRVIERRRFIGGGGPAGLAAGIAIRQRGLRVMVAILPSPPSTTLRRRVDAPHFCHAESSGRGARSSPGHSLSRHSIPGSREGRQRAFPGVLEQVRAPLYAGPRDESRGRGRGIILGNARAGSGRGEVTLDSGKVLAAGSLAGRAKLSGAEVGRTGSRATPGIALRL